MQAIVYDFLCQQANVLTRRRSESVYIRQVHDNVMMYTFTRLHTCLPSNVRHR